MNLLYTAASKGAFLSHTQCARVLLKFAVLLLFLDATLFCQMPTATLNGSVSDPNGAVITGAKVTITAQGTGVSREQLSGIDGQYLFANLVPGVYSIRVQAQGFAIKEFKDVKVEVGHAGTLNVPMVVAGSGEVITVTGGEASVDLQQSEVQSLIEEKTVEEIPLNGRNFLELAFLVPGNHATVNFDPTKTNTLEVSSAGSFGRGGNISVDGGDNNDEVVGGTLANFPQDSISEFQIATNRYTAEVGRSASSVINIITKSGNNSYHGSAFIFERNRKLDALAATFDRSSCVPGEDCRPPFDRQQYGGSFSGPIVKDRAWLFVSAENRHQNGTVPVGYRDFTQNTVVTGGFAGAPLRDKLFSSRLDVKLTEHDTLYGRYSYNESTDTSNGSLHSGVSSGSAANLQKSLNRFNSAVANWTHTFGTDKVNSFIFHYDAFLNNIPAYSPDAPTLNVSGLGLNPDGKPAEIVFPDLQDGQTYRAPQRTPFDRYQLRDNFAWTLGKHSLHVGGEFQNYGAAIVFDLYGSSTVYLTQDFATQDLNGDGVINDKDIPIAAVLMSSAPVRPPSSPQERSSYLAGFIQDDWRVTPNLTVNLGFRYEYDTNLFGTSSLHDPCPAPPTVPTSPCIWAVNALNLHRSSDPKDFSPRVGFAWDPFKNSKTVVRGGYGIYYDRVALEDPLLELLLDGRRLSLSLLNGSVCSNAASCSSPGALFDVGTPTLANPYVGAPAPVGVGINVIANNARHPLVQQFTFGLQQQLPWHMLMSADGIHNFGYRMLMGRELRDANNAPVIITDPLSGAQNNVTEIGSYGKSWYDGLLVSVQKPTTSLTSKLNYSFTANYTLSKAFSYAGDDQIPFNTGAQADIIMGGNNLAMEKGYSPTDERHHISFFGSLGVPFGINISPIWALSSSIPGDPSISLPNIGNTRIPILSRGALGREIQTGAQLNAVIDQWNALPSCPSTPTSAGPFPCNVGRVGTGVGSSGYIGHVDPSLHFGSWFDSFDLRLTKTFKFAERHQVDLVAEAFNLFNRANIRGFTTNNYFGYNTTLASGSQLQVSDTSRNAGFNKAANTAGGYFGAGGPRAFQFAARYRF